MHVLAVVAERPGARSVVHHLILSPPGAARGDVADPWAGGGAVWRVPHFGPETRYRVLRRSPSPETLATWP